MIGIEWHRLEDNFSESLQLDIKDSVEQELR